MRCSSKLPARYPDAGLHTETGEGGGSKWLQRVEHIVLPLFFEPKILFLLGREINSIETANLTLEIEIENLSFLYLFGES